MQRLSNLCFLYFHQNCNACVRQIQQKSHEKRSEIKKTDTDANLLFIDETKHNEFLPGLFLSPSSNKKQIIKKRNISNTAAIVFDAKEDEIVIFPSKTPHQTQPNIKNNNRVSISADIFIASKNSENLEHLVTPFKNWKSI